ncbi:MAG TPA: glutamate-5-semialdehyde dehydrogenase [Bacteroidales bacterium]|jgi:glutamate-5-semialdehyde dehydrogenase|nr:glutamate-5-semialdehyde dehydrogenase [Bacteroidales bacterium]HOS70814.1 glutamate-5-semialdehyde dehydrogenase [Bacteroidales bacterium]HQH24431.1 glutamate-5-semialdehyde dehydrogenase [Bacteroidales bacterium]HQJ81436.1 glutamate-5-semialdehyde dehydrogenase [Bacteroidales bacterium]
MDCTPIFQSALSASRKLNNLDTDTVNRVLNHLADKTEENIPLIMAENEKDLSRMDRQDPKYDRLQLTPGRIKNIAADIRNVSRLDSPLGRISYDYTKPNGLRIKKISVPFGVIGIIYEARPNVTFDVFSLCLKSGNACILKGGSDAIHSNTAIVKIIKDSLADFDITGDIVALLPPGREETAQLLNAVNYVDLIIPRGSQSLIDFVRKNATIPVIETGAGICHSYFDEYGDRETGRKVIHNAKTRRVSVCNALDCLVIHESRLDDLGYIVGLCQDSDVIIQADEKALKALRGKYPDNLLEAATDDSFGTEFLDYKMAVKTVSSFDEAIEHIAQHSSQHSEAIISGDRERQEMFCKMTDAAAVYVNTSTAFTDGAEFGLGAEIGISTQKMHARGPMALEALTTYKWIIEGNGQTRP